MPNRKRDSRFTAEAQRTQRFTASYDLRKAGEGWRKRERGSPYYRNFTGLREFLTKERRVDGVCYQRVSFGFRRAM